MPDVYCCFSLLLDSSGTCLSACWCNGMVVVCARAELMCCLSACVTEKLPENIKPLSDVMRLSEGCVLLLVLKQHLKEMYGLTEG